MRNARARSRSRDRKRANPEFFSHLPHIAVVLLSHNRYDHCDRRTLGAIEALASIVVTPRKRSVVERHAAG
jgi:L-ascorbate metabolism protein UlaG (beta-lactamase superfamily)